VLGTQVDDFAARRRFADAVLGLLSLTERVRTLAATPGANQPPTGAHAAAVTNFFLGIISVGRTLRATLGGVRAEPDEGEPGSSTGPEAADRIMR
jgi:hypothetical protein